jgi:hypothetical protein
MHQLFALLAGQHQLPPGAAQGVVGAVRELDVSDIFGPLHVCLVEFTALSLVRASRGIANYGISADQLVHGDVLCRGTRLELGKPR